MSPTSLFVFALLLGFDSISDGKKNTAAGKLSSIQKQVEAIYRRVAPCLELTPTLNNQLLSYNSDLETHWKEILSVTSQYRNLPPHNGSYYAGTRAGTQICQYSREIAVPIDDKKNTLVGNSLTAPLILFNEMPFVEVISGATIVLSILHRPIVNFYRAFDNLR